MEAARMFILLSLWLMVCINQIMAATIPQDPGLYLEPSATAPTGAKYVTPSFPSLAFEFANLSTYAGNATNPVTLSQNLINEISIRTNSSVYIRIGGNSGDNVVFNGALTSSMMTPNFQIGPRFFDGVRNFPGVQWILQVRLKPGPGATLQNSIDIAVAGMNAITASHLYSIELGNEPNNWPNPNISTYMQRFSYFEQGISQAVSTIPPGPIYQCLDSLAMIYPGAVKFYPSDILGSNTLDGNGRIKAVAAHYYQTIGPFDFQEDLMNHNAVMSNLNGYVSSIDYLAQTYPGMPYILDEVGDGLEQNPGELQGLGSALWAIDFSLYAATIGVYRVHFQNEVGEGFNIWTVNPPFVAGTYYALPYIADFIGSTGDTQISGVLIPNNSQGFFSAYAAYESGNLVRMALLNMRVWTNSSAPQTRPSENFTVAVPSNTASVRIEVLNAAGGATALTGITWAGLEWTVASNGNGVAAADTTSIVVVDGNPLTVEIPDSSAMMLFFE